MPVKKDGLAGMRVRGKQQCFEMYLLPRVVDSAVGEEIYLTVIIIIIYQVIIFFLVINTAFRIIISFYL